MPLTVHDAYVFERACNEDVERVWEMIQDAQALMKSRGSSQWQNGYPNPTTILNDIANGTAYVIRSNDLVMAYGSISFDPEPAYHPMVCGTWLSDWEYVILHRLVVATEAKKSGFASKFLHETQNLAATRGVFSFRVDTIEDNIAMRNCLEKFGFIYTGECEYNKNPRMCFEKLFKPINNVI
eukprot:GDKJ01014380.1.p1 GENE.GDKJ01014380.1~~GDKJ01014380.1.p1  ORF type:complete len:182 (-),score=25.11 GDKJ01014380.1:94-639(-)